MKNVLLAALLFISISLLAVDNFAGNCLEFDGTDQYVQITIDAPQTDYTYEVYFKTGDPDATISSMREPTLGLSYDRDLYLSNGNIYHRLFQDEIISSSGQNYANDNWHHAAVVVEFGVGQRIYADGVEVASGTKDISDFDWEVSLDIGFSGSYFSGQMDEIRLWNVVRSQTDIQLNMNMTLTGAETGLINYWQFNETSGTTASDAMGNNNGTLMNMTDDNWVSSTAPVYGTPVGNGTVGNPYQISDPVDLYWLSTHSEVWDDYFIQTADIDASGTSGWNSGAGFSPIGNYSTMFTGSYDGRGFEIDGLYINRPSTNYAGLFGLQNSASICNLGLLNVDITGANYVGALMGYSFFASINNCFSTGSVIGVDSVGGLVGVNSESAVINSYNTGSVSGHSKIGGLVGRNAFASVINSYSTGSVIGSGSDIGGLVGGVMVSTVNNSFWNTVTSGHTTSAGGMGKTTSEMHTMSTFTDAGWDFIGETVNGTGDLWDIIDNHSYPFFIWQSSISADFYAVPTEVLVETDIQFTDISYGYPSGWQWDFDNDGIYDSTEQNPVYSYSSTGTYSVKLTISCGGNSSTIIKADYIDVISSVSAPENVQVSISNGDAVLSWDAVTEDDEGNPIVPDGYIVLFSESDNEYFFLGFTNDIVYTHLDVALYRPNMFYQLVTLVNSSSRQLSCLQELDNSGQKVKWEDVKRELERMERSDS